MLYIIDAVVEKIRAIGHYAPAQLAKYIELTQLSEEVPKKTTVKLFLQYYWKTPKALLCL